MGSGGCAISTVAITEMLAGTEGARRARGLVAAGADGVQFVQGVIDLLSDDVQAVVRMEMAELPEITATSVMYGWALADAAGKPFVMRSVVPDSVMDFARNQRVRLALDVDETGVTLNLSHVPTRHAEWYRNPANAAAI